MAIPSGVRISSCPPCRLSFVFARSAPVVVVLRRGPSQWVEVIKWNTRDDSFEHGHWFHGRIYEGRCGLSPDGRLLVYFAMKAGCVDRSAGYEQTFTAVSRPPYLTALAMWPTGGTYGGGGRFIDDRTLRLAYGKHRSFFPGPRRHTEIAMGPLPSHHPNHPPTGLRICTNLDHYASGEGFGHFGVRPPEADWYGRDHADRPIFARRGKLYQTDPDANEILMKDFNHDEVRLIESPAWAREWGWDQTF